MPSPFPGMNPYLEQDGVWHDFHERAIPLLAEQLGARLGTRYIVRIDEHVYIHERSIETRQFLGRPDLSVVDRGSGRASERVAVGAAVSTVAPAVVRLPNVDVERLSYLQVFDRTERRLVTVIELLSPANKRRGSDREQYLAKRSALLVTPAHLIEIDLLRGGPPLPMDDVPASDYRVLVSRAESRPEAQVWAFNLRDVIPTIPVPLSEPDSDVWLDVRAAIDHIHDAARYALYIYDSPPQPPLSADDLAWCESILARSAGSRPTL